MLNQNAKILLFYDIEKIFFLSGEILVVSLRKEGSSNKRLGDDLAFSSHFEYSLSPLLGAKAERTQSEGRANPKWKQPSAVIIPKRTKIKVPLLRKINFDFVHFSQRASQNVFLMVVKRENTSNI